MLAQHSGGGNLDEPSMPPFAAPDLTAYDRQPVLAQDAFLRRLPKVTATEARLSFEALVVVADGISWAHETMVDAAQEIAVRDENMCVAQRARLFGAAWALVDNLDAARQLIRRVAPKPDPGPNTTILLERLEAVRKLRNSRDHLAGQIDNIAAAKGFKSPVFGALSYFYAPPERIVISEAGPTLQGGDSIVVYAGGVEPQAIVPIVHPMGRAVTPPVDLFTLSVFRHSAALDPIVARFANWVRLQSASVERQVREQCDREAKRSGRPLETLMETQLNGVVMKLSMAFNAESDLPVGSAGS